MPEHPIPVGTRVRHYGQQWSRARANGTAEVIEIKGPDHRDEYEYLVKHDGNFSGVGPQDEPSWWASYRTIVIEKEQL